MWNTCGLAIARLRGEGVDQFVVLGDLTDRGDRIEETCEALRVKWMRSGFGAIMTSAFVISPTRPCVDATANR